MRNRSAGNLPAFFIPQETFSFLEPGRLLPGPLEIYDFTYLHFHEHLEIGYCVEGSGICRVEERQYPFQKGDVQVIFPFQQHLSKNDAGEHSQWYWINIDLYSLLEKSGFANMQKIEHMIFEEMGLCGIFTPKNYPEIVHLLTLLFQEMTAGTTLHHPELCGCYLYQLLILLSRLSLPLPKLEIRRQGNLSCLSPALTLITEGIQHGTVPSVEILAGSCGMSISNFRRVFHKTIGLGPKEYITRNLLYKAQRLLLTTNMSILEISLETGFQDISGFNRQFLAKTGVTPSAFRREYRKSLRP